MSRAHHVEPPPLAPSHPRVVPPAVTVRHAPEPPSRAVSAARSPTPSPNLNQPRPCAGIALSAKMLMRIKSLMRIVILVRVLLNVDLVPDIDAANELVGVADHREVRRLTRERCA